MELKVGAEDAGIRGWRCRDSKIMMCGNVLKCLRRWFGKKVSEPGGIFSNWENRAPFEVRGRGSVLRWKLFVTRYFGQTQDETMDDGCDFRFV